MPRPRKASFVSYYLYHVSTTGSCSHEVGSVVYRQHRNTAVSKVTVLYTVGMSKICGFLITEQ